MDDSTIDRMVGEAIKARRKAMGQSQGVLAEAAGVTFQQLQKYERGANRVSASRLWRIAQAQGCSVAAYFDAVEARRRTEADMQEVR